MKLSETVTIPLRVAYLCGDLEHTHIGMNPHKCMVCGSQVISLARLLDRKEQVA